jgi:CheY-like chemotaxis protein
MTPVLPKMRTLVVEDESLVAMLIEDMVLDLGWEVVAVAGRLSEALPVAESGTIDFAILDVNLGSGTFSYPVADVLRARQIPFVFATGYGRAGLENGYRAIPTLQKPFDRRTLEKVIHEALHAA